MSVSAKSSDRRSGSSYTPLTAQEKADHAFRQSLETKRFGFSFAEREENSRNQKVTPFMMHIEKATALVPGHLFSCGDEFLLYAGLSLSIFSSEKRRFISNIWRTEPIAVPKPKSKPEATVTEIPENVYADVPIDQYAFFLSSKVDGSCLMIAEMFIQVVKLYGKDHFVQSTHSVGWGHVPCLINTHRFIDSPALKHSVRPTKVPFHRGTPRALFITSGPFEKNFVTLANSFVNVSLMTFSRLSAIQNCLRENEIVGFSDRIGGVIPRPNKRGTPMSDWPQLEYTSKLRLEKIRVHLVNNFDDHFIEVLEKIRMEENDLQIPDGLQTKIEVRTLRVGFHNGRTFLWKPTSIELRESKGRLYFDGILEIGSVVYNADCAIIFQVDYTVRIPSRSQSRESRQKSTPTQAPVSYSEKVIPIGWNAHVPIFQQYKHNPKQDILMIVGPNRSFEGKNMFSVDRDRFSPEMYVSFNVDLTSIPKKAVTSTLADAGTLTSPVAQPTKAPSESVQSSPRLPMISPITPDVPKVQTPAAVAPVPQSPVSSKISESVFVEPPPVKPPPKKEEPIPEEEEVKETRSKFVSEETVIGPPTSAPVTLHTKELSRATKAKLFQSGFAEILDTLNNKPVEVSAIITDAQRARFDPILEEHDAMQINEIVFQFMAFEPASIEERIVPQNIYFTVQFYHFPLIATDKLFLRPISSEPTSPFVIRRYLKDGSVDVAGLQIRFIVDPALMRPDEVKYFTEYLTSKIISIGVWDGDSLLPIGAVFIEPAFLLRQQRPSVMCFHEFDITDHQGMQSVESIRKANTPPTIKGKLHLRIACLGKVGEAIKSENKPVQGFQPFNRPNRVVARSLVENEPELAALVGYTAPTSDTKSIAHKSKRIQIAKMVADEPHSNASQDAKAAHMRKLRMIQMYRESRRVNMIRSALSQNITTTYCIYPHMGLAHFFEFPFQNPYPEDLCFIVRFEDPELRLITDCVEWNHLKQINNIRTPMEKDMIADGFKLFVEGMERVYVPFLFQSFCAGKVLQYPYPSQFASRPTFEGIDQSEKPMQARAVTVSFCIEENKPFGASDKLARPDGKELIPVSVLEVQVIPQPYIVDRTYRFSCGENEFIKQSIVVARQKSKESSRIHVRCSNSNVIVSVNQGQGENADHQEVFFKYRCGPAPDIGRFFLMLYGDPYCTKLVEMWEIIVHSLQRLDMNVVAGQKSKSSILVRGSGLTRDVQCFSSDPSRLTVHPSNKLYLPANGLAEISLSVKPMSAEMRNIYLNVVDVVSNFIVSAWLIKVTSRLPVPNKTFEVRLPYDAPSSKKISYSNPYPCTKTFTLSSNMPHLVQFKEQKLEIPQGESRYIGLKFAPSRAMNTIDILVFVNDEEDKTEECLCVVANYSFS